MTAYSITPVGAQRVEGPLPRDAVSVARLHLEIERLRARVEDEATQRLRAQDRLNRSMRVLASLGRLSPRMASLVAVARKDIWG